MDIFRLPGINTQETMLGTYTDKCGKEKIVVANFNYNRK